MSFLNRPGVYGYRPSTEYRDNYGQPVSQHDDRYRQGTGDATYFDQRSPGRSTNTHVGLIRGERPFECYDPNAPSIRQTRGETPFDNVYYDPDNLQGMTRAFPPAPFIPSPLPHPEPIEPNIDPTVEYYYPRLGPWLHLGPLGSYSPLPLSSREPLSSSYLGFNHSQDWDKLYRTPLSRQPALFAGERRVDGMRSWMDMAHIDGHAACDGLCPWCGTLPRPTPRSPRYP